jgi:hypothetical protein
MVFGVTPVKNKNCLKDTAYFATIPKYGTGY